MATEDISIVPNTHIGTYTRIGGYEVIEAIGAGGVGEVYRARDSGLFHARERSLNEAFTRRSAAVVDTREQEHVDAAYEEP